MIKRLPLFPLFMLMVLLAGCDNNPMDTPESAATHFWQAVIDKDMEKAKNLATWDTVDYLKYLNSNKLHPERFDLGEKKVSDKMADIAVILHTKSEGQESIRVPGRTILIKTEHGWRVDVKKSLGSVIKQSVNNVFDQLNNMMQKGINELDKSFSDSMDEISKGLEEGAKELQRELEKALPNAGESTPNVPKAQEI